MKSPLKQPLDKSKKSLLYPILGWTILLNACLFAGLYLFFRSDFQEKFPATPLAVNTPHSESNPIAKSMPLSATQVELISQKTPELGRSASSVADTEVSHPLPTLVASTTVGTIPATPITTPLLTKMTKIIKPLSKSTDSSPSISESTNKSPATKSPPSYKNSPPPSANDHLLTARDLPSQSQGDTAHATKAKKNSPEQEFEAKTEQLSEAINQVKRLNQQAIDQANAPTR